MSERFKCGGSDLAVGYLPGYEKSTLWIFPGSFVECPGCGGSVRTVSDGPNVRLTEHADERTKCEIEADIDRHDAEYRESLGRSAEAARALLASGASLCHAVMGVSVEPEVDLDADEWYVR